MSTFTDFFLDPVYLNIVKVTLILLIAMFILWWSYKKLSKKDLFTLKKPDDKKVGKGKMFVYWLKYIFIFPILTFFWFVIFVLCLRILSDKIEISSIMFLGIVLVSAVRIAAYLNESMAEDLAKMLPLTLLAGFILSPSFITTNVDITDFYIFKDNIIGFLKYLLFIIVLEWILRGINWIVTKKRKIAKESDE